MSRRGLLLLVLACGRSSLLSGLTTRHPMLCCLISNASSLTWDVPQLNVQILLWDACKQSTLDASILPVAVLLLWRGRRDTVRVRVDQHLHLHGRRRFLQPSNRTVLLSTPSHASLSRTHMARTWYAFATIKALLVKRFKLVHQTQHVIPCAVRSIDMSKLHEVGIAADEPSPSPFAQPCFLVRRGGAA